MRRAEKLKGEGVKYELLVFWEYSSERIIGLFSSPESHNPRIPASWNFDEGGEAALPLVNESLLFEEFRYFGILV